MSSYDQLGDPFDEGRTSVSVYRGQQIARRVQAELTDGDAALSPLARGLLEQLGFRDPTRRAIEEARKRGELGRLIEQLAIVKADILIAMERLYAASEIGRTRAQAEIAENQARQASAEADRNEARTRAQNAAELAALDAEIARLKRDNEILRLRRQGEDLRTPPPSVVVPPPAKQEEPDHPVVADLKRELGTYHKVKLELRKIRRDLEERRPYMTEEEYQDHVEFLEIRQAEVMSRIMAGEA